MNTTSYLQSNTPSDQMMGVDELRVLTDTLFPADINLPFWTWQILLRDVTFFQMAYPGWSLAGRQYHLDIRHVYTGQTREEWAREIAESDIYTVYDLLDPHLWLISRQSLQNEYHKLFVHKSHWRCPDETDHTKWLSVWPDKYAELEINRLASAGQRDDWERQGRVQGINPCVYSVLLWWMVTNPRLNQ